MTGLIGTYAIKDAAYAPAANKVGLSPRELQSITWKGVRAMFPEDLKKAGNGGNLKKFDEIWAKSIRDSPCPALFVRER